MTAATDRYLIEAVNGQVNLCESQGDAWVTIRRNITWQTALDFGFNQNSPAVKAVFGHGDGPTQWDLFKAGVPGVA